MLRWIVTFFILAIVAGFLGFGGLAGTFADLARFLAVIFVILFVGSLVYNMVTGRHTNLPK